MIVNKINKKYMTRSDMPNMNWLDNNWYVVADNSVLANKIRSLYPRFEFVLQNGELVDAIEIPKTQEEIKKERINQIKNQLEVLDSTVDRQWEDYYIRENVTPVERIAVVIAQKEELRSELQSLNEEGTDE